MKEYRYSIQIISELTTETSQSKTILEIILKKSIDNIQKDNIEVYKIEKIKNYIVSPTVMLLNPFNVIKEIRIKTDFNKRITDLLNYSELRRTIEKYYFDLSKTVKDKSPEHEKFLQELAAYTFYPKDEAILELLKTRYFYVFFGGNYKSNKSDIILLDGFLPSYSLPILYNKKYFENSGNAYLNGNIASEKISAYMLNEDMRKFNLEYDIDKLFFNSEHIINYASEEINNAKIFQEGGIKGKYTKKEIVTISQIRGGIYG